MLAWSLLTTSSQINVIIIIIITTYQIKSSIMTSTMKPQKQKGQDAYLDLDGAAPTEEERAKSW